MFHGHPSGVLYSLRNSFNDGMKKLSQLIDKVYQKMGWLFTPIFLWIIISRSSGWREFDWWDGTYIIGYVFFWRDTHIVLWQKAKKK
jgi:hypothetical protein